MRHLLLGLATALIPVAASAADTIPTGRLPDIAAPIAYRLDLTIDPEQPRFSGHTEIDVDLKRATQTLYIHGRDLKVSKAWAKSGASTVAVTYSQVHQLGVVRLDFAKPLAPGKVTLGFDYDAPFGDGAAGLYRVKVGDRYYAWTQFQSIDARAAFPGFDEPGFKTPYSVTLTTPADAVAVTNGAETGTRKAGKMVTHSYSVTEKLPTYLMAFAVGPFDMVEGTIPATAQRATPLPLRILATRGQKDKMAYALKETPRIVQLLEAYFGSPFPFPKLDQIASPVMGGAMENAGAVIYDDTLLLLDDGSPTRQKQNFGMVVAHELGHQWFGDLVTPAWWDDIWLNESFANWIGYRIGDQWRPELNIGVGAIDEALDAMNIDALKVGRPIREPITDSGAIDSAFDAITYGKGGQVVDMVESYMGRETFQKGVQLHLSRHARGNATADDFFRSLAEAAGDPRIVTAMKGFVDQQGVPVVDVRQASPQLSLSQKRYAAIGAGAVPATTWTIPFCVDKGGTKSCTLVDQPQMTMTAKGSGTLMPNAGGHGYYRFDMADADWSALIADAPKLPSGEALATIDSLWASFAAGGARPMRLVEAAGAFAAHSDSNAAVDSGTRLAEWDRRGLVSPAARPGLHRVLLGTYLPKLEAIGFNPARGANGGDSPDVQKLRTDLVSIVTREARDPATRGKLAAAAKAYLAGDAAALDSAFLAAALRVHVEEGGAPAAQALFARALASTDAYFRGRAILAIAGSGRPEVAQWLIGQIGEPRLRATEKVSIVSGITQTLATQDIGLAYLTANFEKLARDTNLTSVNAMLSIPSAVCSVEKAGTLDAALKPQVAAFGRGALTLDRTIEKVRNCGALKAARGQEIDALFTGK
ncbi:ERAP1-like C-terminal domain-containing protein [Sphingomonas laterariae]|uniref:Aminopeptidase n=1 Tax=Edaphosphingomonas laterariae TaxID=861865 RepID=A0A239G0L2_9SPHN|nr:M1 family metallopeptidase [Sphingomonas laterariae]SNS62669.1 ERAP1-like C-terminal domain-containing protein [Sphingomonas laterariae]